MMKFIFTLLIAIVALAADAAASTALAQTVITASDGAQQPKAQQPAGPQKDTFGDAVISPLGDLNLTQTYIPPILLEAAIEPYASPSNLSCKGLSAQISPLDDALGADLDVPATTSNQSLLERGTVLTGDIAVGAVRGATESLVPFRGLVRKLTGAEAHAKKVRAAIAAGAVRRAYLTGLGEAAGCQFPAAPQKQTITIQPTARR
jgi:hypothetical protein